MNDTKSTLQANRSRILVADDESPERNAFQMLLESTLKERRIDIVNSGLEAVECFRDVHHGAIVLNMHRPARDGVKTYEGIKALCRASHWEMPAFIFCTECNLSTVFSKLTREDHRNRVLHKPVRPNILIESVKQALQEDQQEKQIHTAA